MDREFLKKTDASVKLNITGGKIDSYRSREETKSTVRVYRDGKIGVAGALGEVDEAELTARAEKALAYGIPYRTKLDGALEQREVHDEVVLEKRDFLPAMQHLLDRIGEACPRFAMTNQVQLREKSVEYRNSEGRNLFCADRWLSISLVFQNRGAGNLMDAVYGLSTRRFDEEKIVAQCKQLHDAFFTPADIEEGKLPVVMDMDELVGNFLNSFIDESYVAGSSLVSGKLGQKIFSEKLSVANDANPETHPGACFFDDEGVVSPDYRPKLIENGVLKGVLTTKNSAAKYDLPNFGSAASDYDSAPSLGLSAYYVAPTARRLSELVPEKAIYIAMASGGDVTPDGHYATPVQCAYLMEGGKIVGRLPELNIGGNFLDMLGEDFVGAVIDPDAIGERLCVVNMQVTK